MAFIKPLPPVDFLARRFDYCPITGRLTYAETVSQTCKKGNEAGFVHWTGYRYVKFLFDGRKMQVAVHRVAWAIHNGVLPHPDMEIDHIDRDKLNNRISNLRLVTRAENARNTSATIKGRRGVSRQSGGRSGWRAYTYIGGRYVHLGTFKTEGDAVKAVAAQEVSA